MFVAPDGPDHERDAIFVRVTLLHNPGAGDSEQPDGERLQSLIRAAGHTVRYQRCDDDAWAAALESPSDIIAVAGGDGTVGRVAKKVIGRDVAVAPLPLGTANNIARTLGVADLAVEDIVAGWRDGKHVAFDAGIANGPWGARYFIEAMGLGLFARTIQVADHSKTLAALKDAESKVTYAIGMLRERLQRCAPHHLDIRIDDKCVSGDYVLFEAMNMEFVGPNLYLAPDMDPSDGLLDVVLVTTAERGKLQKSLAEWQNGELRRPELTRHRARAIELEWDGYQVHFDDEAWPPEAKDTVDPPALTRIEVGVERNALNFFAPAFAAT
jgi:diacylglycerol kinase (ATP)